MNRAIRMFFFDGVRAVRDLLSTVLDDEAIRIFADRFGYPDEVVREAQDALPDGERDDLDVVYAMLREARGSGRAPLDVARARGVRRVAVISPTVVSDEPTPGCRCPRCTAIIARRRSVS